MKKLFFSSLVLAALLSNANSAKAQMAGNAVVTEHTVYNSGYQTKPVDLNINNYSSNFSSMLEANVMINVKAVSYTAIFSLTQAGKSVEEAEAAMRTRTQILEGMLKQQNSGILNIFIDPVSMIPTYETEVTEKKLSRTFNEVPTGFEMKKNIHITFKEQSQINEIIAIAAKAEVYDFVKVDYNIEGKDAVLEQLRNDALRILMNKKAAMENAGIHVRLTNVGEMQGSAFPAERYAQYLAYKAGTAPYYAVANNNKKNQPVVAVQYNYAEKQKTSYYDKVSDKQFDKIINPVVSEPMVQIYLSMKAQFVIYIPEQEAKDKIYNERLRAIELRDLEQNVELKRIDALATAAAKRLPVARAVRSKQDN